MGFADDNWTDPNTGKQYSRREWLIYEQDGMVSRIKRLSDKQLAYINSLEYELGYKPANHENMSAYQAIKTITRLQKLVKERQNQIEINLTPLSVDGKQT